MSETTSWSASNRVDPTALLDLYQISDEDLDHIKEAGKMVAQHLNDVVAKWYEWLGNQVEFEQFFSDPEVLRRTQALQLEYWQEFLRGQVDADYIAQRQRLGQTHARIGLSLSVYLAGADRFIGVISDVLAREMTSQEGLSARQAIGKLMSLDVGVVVETYTQIEKETIRAQSRSLMEMSTPVTEIWTGILLLPLVGIIDSKRAQDIMNAVLSKISESHARMFILDISGVGVVDTAVANHLVKITKATRLMGCESTISGVSPAIAQTIVELGIDVGTVQTTATMRDALADAFRNLGVQVTELRKDHAR